MASLGVTPGAVFALADSWRTTNVYVVGCASVVSSQVDCAEFHAFPATKTNFAVHESSEALMLRSSTARLLERAEEQIHELRVVLRDAVRVSRAAVRCGAAVALVVAHRGEQHARVRAARAQIEVELRGSFGSVRVRELVVAGRDHERRRRLHVREVREDLRDDRRGIVRGVVLGRRARVTDDGEVEDALGAAIRSDRAGDAAVVERRRRARILDRPACRGSLALGRLKVAVPTTVTTVGLTRLR